MESDGTERRQPTPIPWVRILLLGLLLTAAIFVAVLIVLGSYDLNHDKKLRLDAFKLVLAGIAGYGAAVTVWLALRRQQHFEHHSWTQRELDMRRQGAEDLDNRARRALELYSAAAEQLGSDQAAVRLAGVYSFERLASDDAAYRQTVVDVFCAYLRMTRAHEHDAEHLAEQEVRSSVQSLLVRHLSPPDSPLAWPDVRVNLAGAVLRDFAAAGAYFSAASFTGAEFHGNTTFDRAKFVRKGRFDRCRFEGKASFRRTRFEAGASFETAEFFGEEAGFTGAQFGGSATQFRQSKFHAKQVIFRGVKFASEMSTNFSKTEFPTTANFKRSRFTSRITSFNRSVFALGSEPFVMATFSDRLLVDDAGRWEQLLRDALVTGTLEENAPTSDVRGSG